MSTVKDHYTNVLSDVYSWMFGGVDTGVEKNAHFFSTHNITPSYSGIAVDLGAGCGFQSIPLAQLGFSVTAVDIDSKLLHELEGHAEGLAINAIQDDLINFDLYTGNEIELAVCMTDTLLHLESKQKVESLFKKVFAALDKNGTFIITFRDLSSELSELDRFIPVKSDQNTIFTCFLEYEPETVKVHDIVYSKDQNDWRLNKGFYRKLRLSKDWVDSELNHTGFSRIESIMDNGMVTVIAKK